jgi:isocitrate dehydrogenase kinase/phosphatase
MNNNIVNDNNLSMIKIWHSIKKKFIKRSPKLDSANINENLFNRSVTNFFHSNNFLKKKMVLSKSFNIKRGDFYSDYNPII